MKTFTKHILWAIGTLLIVSIAFSLIFQKEKPETITLNELAAKINASEVTKIKIAGGNLSITLKNGKEVNSKKETEAGLTETLQNFGVNPENMRTVEIAVTEESGWQFWAGIILPSLLPIAGVLLIFWFMFRQARGGVNQAFNFGRANIRLSNFAKERVLFSDVAGAKEAKEELVEIVDFLKNPKKFSDLGARIPRGILLVGLPGTGKTLLARAVAGESNVPFFNISASEFVEMFVGVGASRIRDAFATARKAAPAILFIDEIDAVGRQRGAGLGSQNDEREQTLNQILVELDGFEGETNVIVLAATNRPDVLDPALLRPGRFDRRVILDLPDIKDREEILKIHARGKVLEENIDWHKVATRTPGFSGAELANLVNEAAILAGRKNQSQVSQENILESIEKVLLGPQRKNRVISDKEKEVTAYHEAGHALVGASIEGNDAVHKVTIIGRGMAGGYTLSLPSEERHIRTKKQMIADMARAMGGLVAEKLVFSDVSTGPSNDLKHASDIARRLVTKYGMSEELGPITFGDSQEMVFLGREISTEKNYSEDTAKKIDAEVHRFITHAYDLAKKVIKENKAALDAIAQKLIEKETLEQEEFYAILEPFNIKTISVL
jgi:cell division protease FtsH